MGRSSRHRLLLALAGVFTVATVLACNGLIGLSDYDRVECTGRVCDGGASDATVDVVVPDSGRDAGGLGAGPVSWARWPMPNYPDAGLPNEPLFEPDGDDAVKQVQTQLIWRKTPSSPMSQAEAVAYCRGLQPGEWRLPKRIELVTLLDYSDGSPFISRALFPGVPQIRAWTSSEVRPFTAGPEARWWIVNFDDGTVGQERSDRAYIALCVKGQ